MVRNSGIGGGSRQNKISECHRRVVSGFPSTAFPDINVGLKTPPPVSTCKEFMPPQYIFEMHRVDKRYGERFVLKDINLSFF
jgi:hypothetical protein